MKLLPHIAGRVFNTPLLISRIKLDAIMAVLTPRMAGDPVQFGDAPPVRGYDVTSDGIAVIPVLGTLVRRTTGLDAMCGLTSYAEIGADIAAAIKDPGVRGIMLDIDSPGGEAGGVFDLADAIYAARGQKPIWSVANEDAFSAAYAIAAATDKIYLSRTAGVGSVGVIAVHLDQSQAEADAGLVYTPIFAGAHKNDLSPHEPLSDPARATLQSEVDRVYDLFVTSVATMRGMTAEAVRGTEAGIYMGDAAVSGGLADRLGTYAEAMMGLRAQLSPTGLLTAKTSKGNKRMNNDAPQIEAAVDTPQAPDLTALRTEMQETARGEAMAYVTEVTEICMLAGVPDKAASYIASAIPVAEVRKSLLDARAKADEAATISGQQPSPSAQQGKAKIDTAAIYARRNAKKESK